MSLIHSIKNLLRPLVKLSPIPLTKGQRIDYLSKKIIFQHCQQDSNCIDVGAHKGEILDIFLQAAPKGQQYAFEPLPHLYEKLIKKYPKVHLFNCALSNETTTSTFQHVVTNPAYSGIKQRAYEHDHERIDTIEVELKRMDDCVPINMPIDFIKIDVEGAELYALKGAQNILRTHRPMLLFEHGKGGADFYSYGPMEMFDFLHTLKYKIYTLRDFLNEQKSLSQAAFSDHFEKGDEFYFVAK